MFSAVAGSVILVFETSVLAVHQVLEVVLAAHTNGDTMLTASGSVLVGNTDINM